MVALIESVVKTQRILCLKRFLDERNSPWKKFLSFHLNDVGSSLFLQCNFNPVSLHAKLPQYYKDCLIAWADFFRQTPETRNDVLNTIIWNNQDLQIGGRPIYNKKLVDAGFIKTGHILSTENKLKKWDTVEASNLSKADDFLFDGHLLRNPFGLEKVIKCGKRVNRRD